MNQKKLGVALLVVVVLGAIAANSAFAASEYSETGGAWYVGGSKLAEGTTKSLTTSVVAEKLGGLETTVAGTPLKLTATGVNCSSCVIKNVGTAAKAEGALEFTGVSVVEPATCSTTSTVTTKALTAVVGMNTAGTQATLKLTPAEGATFATVKIEGESCSISGTYKVTGTVFGKATNATGVFAANQEVSLSKEIQESAGTATSLKFGENAAIPIGSGEGSIGGTEFGAKEK